MIHRVLLFFFFFLSWSQCLGNDEIQKDGVCPPVLDIIVLFDTSGGNDSVYQQQKNWTIEIVRELPIHEDAVRVGLIQYSEDAKTEFNLSKYSERNDLIKNLDTLDVSQGDTKTGIALNKADEEIFNYTGGARLKANRMIILFTDGLSMDNPTKAAKTLRRKGVKIFSISVNSIGFVPEMLGIVGDADNIFGPTDEERLKERLLTEVEHSRSCDVQLKKNAKTTSAFKSRTTEFSTVSSVPIFTTEDLEETTSVAMLVSELTESLEEPIRPRENNNTSEQFKSESQVDDLEFNGAISNSTSTPLPDNEVSQAWSEPIQLFTVETDHFPEVQHLNNLTNLLSEEPVVKNVTGNQLDGVKIENKSDVIEESSAATISSLTTLAPTTTTICITQPISTSTSVPLSQVSTTQSFLVKLGVKMNKEKEKDPISKFLGRDVPNITAKEENDVASDNDIEKETQKLSKNSSGSFSNISEEISVKKSQKAIKEETGKIENSSDSVLPSKPTTKFAFATRVTFRPVFTTPSKTSTTTGASLSSSLPLNSTTTVVPNTITPSLVVNTTALSSSSTTIVSTTIPSPTPTQSSSSKMNTLDSVTAFPTLLSMEKAVTLPLNTVPNKDVKPMKKKIRRIIKRRRNITPASKVKKITQKVIEVKPEPTPTTPPVRSTAKPAVAEEQQEEITSPGVQCPMDILFVVDSSGSIARTYDTQKDFLTVLIKKVEPSRSHRVGLIQFAGPHIQKMEWSFDTHSKNSQLLSAIRSVRHLTGTTYIGAALELSLILLDSRRKHTETTVILISDGFSQDDATQQVKLLRQLPNVKMYAISLNKLTNTRFLTDIVGDRKNLFVNDESKWFEEFFTKKLRCIPTTRL